MKNLGRRNKASSQQGSSLLEVLIATVVLSIGLLGLAGLQTAALKVNQTASARSQAAFLTNGIFDRMRANRDAALNGVYDINGIANAVFPTAGSVPVDVADLAAWKASIDEALPGGDGSICRTNTPGTNPRVCDLLTGQCQLVCPATGEYLVVMITWTRDGDDATTRIDQTVTTMGQL